MKRDEVSRMCKQREMSEEETWHRASGSATCASQWRMNNWNAYLGGTLKFAFPNAHSTVQITYNIEP
jgi:hypothetical protein